MSCNGLRKTWRRQHFGSRDQVWKSDDRNPAVCTKRPFGVQGHSGKRWCLSVWPGVCAPLRVCAWGTVHLSLANLNVYF